jgi:hypothetical protein
MATSSFEIKSGDHFYFLKDGPGVGQVDKYPTIAFLPDEVAREQNLTLSETWKKYPAGIYLFLNVATKTALSQLDFKQALRRFLNAPPFKDARFLWIENPTKPLATWRFSFLSVDSAGEDHDAAVSRFTVFDFRNYTLAVARGSSFSLNQAGDGFTVGDDNAVAVVENTASIIAVLTNDSFEGTPVVSATTSPTHGAVVINGDNTITYTPTGDYTGADSFSYTVTSGGVTETATVRVNVTAVNDTPNIESAIADQSLSEDFASYTIDLDAAFADAKTADPALVYGVSGNTHINVSIASGIATITPSADWNGSETLTFTATDARGLSISRDVGFAVTRPEGFYLTTGYGANRLPGVGSKIQIPFQGEAAGCLKFNLTLKRPNPFGDDDTHAKDNQESELKLLDIGLRLSFKDPQFPGTETDFYTTSQRYPLFDEQDAEALKSLLEDKDKKVKQLYTDDLTLSATLDPLHPLTEERTYFSFVKASAIPSNYRTNLGYTVHLTPHDHNSRLVFALSPSASQSANGPLYLVPAGQFEMTVPPYKNDTSNSENGTGANNLICGLSGVEYIKLDPDPKQTNLLCFEAGHEAFAKGFNPVGTLTRRLLGLVRERANQPSGSGTSDSYRLDIDLEALGISNVERTEILDILRLEFFPAEFNFDADEKKALSRLKTVDDLVIWFQQALRTKGAEGQRTEEASLTKFSTTAWAYVRQTGADAPIYCAQPDEAILYRAEKSDSKLLRYMEVPTTELLESGNDSVSVFPLFPYAGARESLTDYRQLELQFLNPLRRSRIASIPPDADPTPGDTNGTRSFSVQAHLNQRAMAMEVVPEVDTHTGTTPQGLLATFSKDYEILKTLLLAKDTAAQELSLTDVRRGTPLRDALQSNQLFMVISNPADLQDNFNGALTRRLLGLVRERANRPPGTSTSDSYRLDIDLEALGISNIELKEILVILQQEFFPAEFSFTPDATAELILLKTVDDLVTWFQQALNALTIDGWNFDFNPAKWRDDTILIFKFHDKPLLELVQSPQMWSQSERFKTDVTATRPQLLRLLQDALAKDAKDAAPKDRENYRQLARAARNENWSGIIALNVPLQQPLANALPADLKAIAAGIDAKKFFAQYIGIETTPIDVVEGKLEAAQSSLFGLIDYKNEIIEASTKDYDFTVPNLQVLFQNLQVKAFSCELAVTLNKLFDEPTTLLSATSGLNIIRLKGSAENHNGQTTYAFSFSGDNHFALPNSPVLNEVEIIKAQFSTDPSGEESKDITGRFSFWGRLNFKHLETFDIFSFGGDPLPIHIYEKKFSVVSATFKGDSNIITKDLFISKDLQGEFEKRNIPLAKVYRITEEASANSKADIWRIWDNTETHFIIGNGDNLDIYRRKFSVNKPETEKIEDLIKEAFKQKEIPTNNLAIEPPITLDDDGPWWIMNNGENYFVIQDNTLNIYETDKFLSFSKLILTMTFPKSNTKETTFMFEPSNLLVDTKESQVRPNSLYAKFPLKFAGFHYSPAGQEKPKGYLPVKTPFGSNPLPTGTWYGLSFDLDLGNVGALAGANASFVSSLIAVWAPIGGSSTTASPEPKVFVGLKLPGLGGDVMGFSLQSVIKLGFKSVEFLFDTSTKGYLLKLKNVVLKLLVLSLPPKAQTELIIFGNPASSQAGENSVGWYLAYVKNEPNDKKQLTSSAG